MFDEDLIARKFHEIIWILSEKSADKQNFTGTGLVLYDPDILDKRLYTSLRPSVSLPYIVSLLNTNKAAEQLFKLSDKSNMMHDGFHFFNKKTGKLDHPAQYFVPPIIRELKINESYGTRYHSALYGSCIDGISLTGTVNNDNRSYIFKKGFLVENIKVGSNGSRNI